MRFRFEKFRRLGLRGWRYYFRLRALNGEIIAQSEGYQRSSDRTDAIRLIQLGAAKAEIIDRD